MTTETHEHTHEGQDHSHDHAEEAARPPLTIAVEHDGEQYSGVIMQVLATSLAFDGTALTAAIQCEGGGYTIALGQDVADARAITGILAAAEVPAWELLRGTRVVVLTPGDDPEGRPVGLASLNGEVTLFDQAAADAELAADAEGDEE